MCGRFAVTLPLDAMAQLFDATVLKQRAEFGDCVADRGQPLKHVPQTGGYNVCPSKVVHVVTSQHNQRVISPMRWGFLPHWYQHAQSGALLINARSETVAQKPAFAQACRRRRGLLYVDGYFEWSRSGKQKIPFYISAPGGLALGIIYNDGHEKKQFPESFAIVTTAAHPDLDLVHHRMPLILEAKDWPLWLGEAGHGAARLMSPYAKPVNVWQVSAKVNKNNSTGVELIEPV